MLARGIRSYHRPARLDEALDLARRGMTPLAGGTRLLASPVEVPNVLDLSALSLASIALHDGDVVLGACTTLQDAIDSDVVWEGTAGLLPEACRAQSASRLLRGMATLGGESVHGAHDSEVVAALLALNAVYVISGAEGRTEVPALRFLKKPAEDLVGGGLLTSIIIPGAPQGTALERVAVLPSAPALIAVAATISFSGDVCLRARIALTGLKSPPSRVLEAEARLEGTPADPAALERCIQQILTRAVFREDAHAPAAYRSSVARTLVQRALRAAIERARSPRSARPPRTRRVRSSGSPTTSLPYFTSGPIEITINGELYRPEADARSTLLELLRREGFHGVKHGCETGDCGACAVLLDGRPVASCLTLALRAHGRSVQTIEGLGTPDALHPIQSAFVETGAVQCGFCTPAMELCAKALLDETPRPSEEEVRDALSGCLCRCTGYLKPVQAVLRAAERNGGDTT